MQFDYFFEQAIENKILRKLLVGDKTISKQIKAMISKVEKKDLISSSKVFK